MNNDCVFCIFAMLNVSDIVNCLYVCKRFYTIAKNNLLWKQLFKVKFYNVCIDGNNFENNYKKYSILNNFLIKNSKVNVNMNITKIYLEYGNLRSIPKEIGQWLAYKDFICIITNYNQYQKNLGNWLAYKHFLCSITNYNQFQKKLDNWLAYKYFLCTITS